MLATSGQYNAALPIIETLVKSQPNNAHFWRIYCNILEGGYYTTRAKQAMREGAKRFNLKALELRADFLQAPIYAKTADLISAQQNLYAQADKWLLEAPEIADLESQCDAIPYFIHIYFATNDRIFLEKTSKIFEKICPKITNNLLAKNKRKSQFPRIGIISNFLKDDIVTICYQPLINALMADYPHWEFLGFSYHENKNGQHAEMPKLIFLPRDIDSAQKIIAESECDLLLYLDLGMKFFSYLLAHARLAPIQCITGAHPTTSGIKNIDYFLSSAEMEIASAADHYSEKLVLLATNPGSGPTPPENIPEFSKASLGLPEQGNIYLFPHNLLKCHPDHWPIFSEILERDKNAQLIFFANPSASSLGELFRNILQQNLNTHQIKRTHILTWQDQVRFCRILELADIVLDAIYFSMGSTAYLALGLGIPVVTLATDLMRGRGTLGKYNQLEISDCITNSSAEYIELALKIAQNKAFRQILQNKIKEKNQRLKNLKPATISLGQWLEEKLL